jgi:hypothetical protein
MSTVCDKLVKVDEQLTGVECRGCKKVHTTVKEAQACLKAQGFQYPCDECDSIYKT